MTYCTLYVFLIDFDLLCSFCVSLLVPVFMCLSLQVCLCVGILDRE